YTIYMIAQMIGDVNVLDWKTKKMAQRSRVWYKNAEIAQRGETRKREGDILKERSRKHSPVGSPGTAEPPLSVTCLLWLSVLRDAQIKGGKHDGLHHSKAHGIF
ncbi:hypothetical protein, partial [Butyricicoccus pullicaecorum]|uniref:hypothetical protein n=1 Tax=Butyricicoccus pullicaecorum TaxID=501571 RepID=UPI003990B239